MLPLLAGIAVGAGAVVAVNNRKELKEKISSSAKALKETVVEKTKSATSKKDDTEKVEKKEDE